MHRLRWLAALALFVMSPARADTLAPELAPIAFLVGHWTDGRGVVMDTGGRSEGSSSFTVENGGAVLVRRDHTDVFDADGNKTESSDQLMTIFSKDGALRADYSDGRHIIHYVSATVVPGRSVTFTSAVLSYRPTFHLAYELTQPDTLAVSFTMAVPGQSDFQPVTTGTLHKAD